MRKLWIAALLGLAGCGQQALVGPLAPAAEGKVACFVPNRGDKTCGVMATFTASPTGKVTGLTKAMMMAQPPIVLEAVSYGRFRDGMVCQPPGADKQGSLRFTTEGRVLGEAETAQLRQLVLSRLAPIMHHEVCTRYLFEGDALRAEAYIDGVRMPALDLPFIWVSPEEGWRLHMMTAK